MLKKLAGLLCLVLAVAAGIGLYVGWDALDDFYMAIYFIDLPWFTGRVLVGVIGVGLALEGARLLLERKPAAVSQ
ncbi:MAG: hypothetical protein SF162_07835 [bacterium]|nr:hypothetical protein [bacterium]